MKHFLAALTLILTATACAPQARPVQSENPDVQSEEEIQAAERQVQADFQGAVEDFEITPLAQVKAMAGYAHLDPKKWVPANLLSTAVAYFDANKSRFSNQKYITIVDFSPRSNLYRFFLIDMQSGQVERYRTTHGAGSDANNDGYAESFGNVEGSGKSSLGFARTAEVYSGNFGPSVRLDGLSSTNSNIRRRAVVFHGWDYVKEANVLQGLSKGCVTLDWNYKDAVLKKIKNGSLMYSGVSK